MEVAFQSGFASALLDVLFTKLTDVFLNELKLFTNVDDAVGKLETTITEVHYLFREVDKSQFLGKFGDVIGMQVDKLTKLCYDAEDVMDEIGLMISYHKSSSGKSIFGVRDSILRPHKTRTISHVINKLHGNINGILEQLRVLAKGKQNGYRDSTSEARPTGEVCYLKFLKEVSLVGRENEFEEIIDLLISHHFNKGVSIIGMDGLGKTTLAQSIPCDERIKQEFPIRLWVHALDGCFNKKELYDQLARNAFIFPKSEAEFGTKESIGNDITCKQDQKNVLIIFDNLLEVKHIDWDEFCTNIFFKWVDKVKIKILITTIDPEISMRTDTYPHYLKYLSDKSCEKMIVTKASSHNHNISKPWYPQAAKLLASKCAGLPLVARIIGLLLAKCDDENWKNLLTDDLWQWPVFKEEILPVLWSSYKDMQPAIKKCLAYFSLFPQYYCYHIDDLTQLWAGEGFIECLNDSLKLERISRDYIADLQGRSILQYSSDATDDGRPSYQINNFAQYFARLVASKTCLRLEEGSFTSSFADKDTRHLSISCEIIQHSLWKKMGELKRLRTILALYNDNSIGKLGKIPNHLFKAMTRLRVLALSGTDVVELPDSIYRLKRLRYLNISNTRLHTLPENISQLRTLQIFKLKNTPKLSCLPKGFQNLTNLLFLDWERSDIEHLGQPSNIGNLSSLQTLPLFLVGEKKGFFIRELQNMNSLRGSICIKNLENVRNGEEAQAAKLHDKSFLKKLELQWIKFTNKPEVKDVLMGLKPHSLLEEIKITGYGCELLPEWNGADFPVLKKICLQRFETCTRLPTLGQFPALQTLVLKEITCLNHFEGLVNDGAGHFPLLTFLEFNDMPALEGWTGFEESGIPQLRILKFVDCPVMENLPSLQNCTMLMELQIRRCQALESLSDLPSSLNTLIISESPLLKAQCLVGGTEWEKVKDVPIKEIND